MIGGIGTPFLKIFNGNGLIIDLKCTEFEYSYSEKSDDQATIVFKSDEPDLIDHEDLQEDKILILIWGYLEGGRSNKRTVYIMDTASNFTAEDITLTIKAVNKAAYLKLNSKDTMRSDTDLEKVAQEIADENGLTVENQITGTKNEAKDNEAKFERFYTGGQTREEVLSSISTTAVPKEFHFRKYDSLPQANKSDAHILEEVANQENESHVKVVGRDDKLIIKQRDLNQAPIRTYVYKGGDGHLISFMPSTNNRATKKNKTETKVVGWDPESGEYVENTVDVTDEDGAILGDMVEKNPDSETKKKSILEGDTWVGFDKYNEATRSEIIDGKITTPIDSTRVKTRFYIPPANIRTISTESTPEGITNEVSNRRSEEQLKSVSARIELIGDPALESEQVITILNVSKKFSGNYYIETISHKLTPGAAYTCSMNALRNALGKTGGESDNKVDAEELGKVKNKEVNTNDQELNLVTIKEE